MAEKPREMSFGEQIRGLPANFWYANFMEILERLAFFGVRAIAPLYLVREADQNGLGLTYIDKGQIYMWWALIQCIVPMVSGGYTERYGYRKSLVVAFLINIVGYLGMARSKPIADYFMTQGWDGAGYWVFLAAAGLVAFGTAIFKPPVHGTIAKTTDEQTSSMGWGLFYWVVNIGGAMAPMAAAQLRGETDWDYVFYGAAIVTACNFIPLFLLYREPEKTPPKAGESEKGPIGVFLSSIFTIFKDLRLVAFLLIFSCFWLMFMQLWDLLPNFIDEWVDTSNLAGFFGWFSEGWVLENGQTKPEILINIDSWSIIALVLVISWLVRKINKVAAMIIGMLISLVGFVGAGATQIGVLCAVMIFVFSIGEMACSPTFSAYVGLIAPPDKKALYMGYSNIPFAIGWALGNLLSGFVYDGYGAKATLALKYLGADTELVARASRSADWSDTLHKIPALLDIERDSAFELARADLDVEADAAARTLREDFKYDRGQIENLALQYLALHPDYREKTITGFAKIVKNTGKKLDDEAKAFVEQVESLLKPAKKVNEDEQAPDGGLPAADKIVTEADFIKEMVIRAQGLASGETHLDEIALAKVVHLLPDIVGKKRGSAFGAVRGLINKDLPPEQATPDAEIVDLLWQRFGDDPGVLNNLALEYLAQATDLIHDKVASMTFEHPTEELDKRMEEIEERVGIDRKKAFAALSAVLGSDDAAVEEILGEVSVATDRPNDRLFVYLINQAGFRFEAVSKVDWDCDRRWLREIVRGDEAALKIVLAGIDEESWFDKLIGGVKGIFVSEERIGEVTEEGVDYYKLAGKEDLIQEALAAKDWAQAPDQAARLLRLNPFEARALVAADVKKTTQVLWDQYHPYLVWVYLGAVGLTGTIGMIVFYYATRRQRVGGKDEA